MTLCGWQDIKNPISDYLQGVCPVPLYVSIFLDLVCCVFGSHEKNVSLCDDQCFAGMTGQVIVQHGKNFNIVIFCSSTVNW